MNCWWWWLFSSATFSSFYLNLNAFRKIFFPTKKSIQMENGRILLLDFFDAQSMASFLFVGQMLMIMLDANNCAIDLFLNETIRQIDFGLIEI